MASPGSPQHIDVVLELRATDIACLRAAFPEAEFYTSPTEVFAAEIARAQRAHLNLIHLDTGYKTDLYPVGADPLHHWAMPRRRRVPHGGGHLSVAPPEYVIVRKLEYFREGGSAKHVTDIHAMLRVSGAEMDHGALQSWIECLGLADVWKHAQP
jgi:hypothetical protein